MLGDLNGRVGKAFDSKIIERWSGCNQQKWNKMAGTLNNTH